MGQIKVRTLMAAACQGFPAERQSPATQRRVIRGLQGREPFAAHESHKSGFDCHGHRHVLESSNGRLCKLVCLWLSDKYWLCLKRSRAEPSQGVSDSNLLLSAVNHLTQPFLKRLPLSNAIHHASLA